MILKLDPRWPLVWRTPTAVQIGADPVRVRLTDVSERDERVLAALVVGVSLPGLMMIAQSDVTELLDALRPVLVRESASSSVRTVAIAGIGPLVAPLAHAIAGPGVSVVTAADSADLADESPDLVIIVGDFVLAPTSHAVWLRRDVPHLPVVFGDSGVTIGPLVEPGVGPCLLCLELHHRDSDEAWAAVASQLLGRGGAVNSPVLVAEALGEVARTVRARLDGQTPLSISVRIDEATGERTARQWQRHPDCGCGELSADQPGSDWANVARRETVRN